MKELITFEDLQIEVIPDKDHVWTIDTCLVALGYGTSESNIRRHKISKPEEFKEGKHFITVSNAHGGEPKTIWTKRGVIRLGFFIKTKRAKRFRDFAEDLVLNEIEKKPISLEEMMIFQLQERIKDRQEIREIKKDNEEIKEDIKMIKAHQVTHPEDYYTIAGYAKLKNIKIDLGLAKSLGRIAKALCRQFGYVIGEVKDPRYVAVGTYPSEILDMVFSQAGLI